MELTAHIHEEDGGYWAEVVELPGCFASGHTLAELVESLDDAIALYLSRAAEPDLDHRETDGETPHASLEEMKFRVPAPA